jgi:hypothetical protein
MVYPASGKEDDSSKQQLRDILTVEAITYQILALDLLGKSKDCLFLERKYRFLLQKHEATSRAVQQELLSSTAIAPMHLEQQPGGLNDEKWPWIVKQWYSEALQSQSWEEDGIFWGSWMNLPDNDEPIFTT